MTASTRSSVSSTASAATSATSSATASVLRQAAAPLAALALTALLGTTAQAQGTSAAPAATPAAASTPVLNIRQIYDRLDAAGYRDLREIEWDHGRYEVKARDAQGARVKLDVDGQTGAVLRSRTQR